MTFDRAAAQDIIARHGVNLTLPEAWEDSPLGKSPIGLNSEIQKMGRDNQIIIGKYQRLDLCILAQRGNGNLLIVGDDVRLRRLRLFTTGDNNVVIIGKGTSWEEGAILCSPGGSTILVGDDCMMSSNVRIRTSDGHGIFDMATREQINRQQDVIIHDHVWLGNGARVSKGAKIGAGSVVAQMGLATGTLAPNSVYGGVPAKLIRSGIVWSRTYDWPDHLDAEQPLPQQAPAAL